MEKKEFSSPARRYGKFFIAFIFITAGVLLLARNLGWISYTLFGILVSWQMLLILLGIYLMLRRQILRGGILLAIGAYLISPYLGWMPAGIHVTLFPIVLIVIGLAFLFRPKRARHERSHRGNFASSQYNSTDGVLHSENTLAASGRWCSMKCLKAELYKTLLAGRLSTCGVRLFPKEKRFSILIVHLVE